MNHIQMIVSARTIKRVIKFLVLLIVLRMVIMIGYGLFRSPSSRLQTIVHSRTDCQAPCWRELQPGESTRDQVQKTVHGIFPSLPSVIEGFANHLANFDDPVYGYYWFDFWTGMPTEVVAENEYLTRIIFTPGVEARNSQASSLKLETVFAELGPPDFYTATTDGLGVFGGMSFLYQDEGLVFRVILHRKPAGTNPTVTCTLPVTPDLPVRTIILVVPGTPETMRRDAVGAAFARRDVIQKWVGGDEVTLAPCH